MDKTRDRSDLSPGEYRLRAMLASPGVHFVLTRTGVSLVEVDEDGRCFQLALQGDYPRDGELGRDRWNADLITATIGPFDRQRDSSPAFVKPGEFLPTVERHLRFLAGIGDEKEIRFVTPGGSEWHPVSTYAVDDIAYVDLNPVQRDANAEPEIGSAPPDTRRLSWLDSQAVRATRLHIEVGYTGSLSGRNLTPFATLFLGNDVFNGTEIREVIDQAIAGKKA